MRYDAAIIGAGADGLAAAATLARLGLKTIVVERAEHPGGRCATREFHPGFHAAPFLDELAPIPAEIYWALGLARHGAIFTPPPGSTALWPDRAGRLDRTDAIFAAASALTNGALRRAGMDAAAPQKAWSLFAKRAVTKPWPGESWATASLEEVLAGHDANGDATAHRAAHALAGRAAHPALVGSALHLLTPGAGGSGLVAGGLHRLAGALTTAAQEAGAEILCGPEVSDIRHADRKVVGLRLADGTEIDARAVVSTLDLKRTFLSLFAWNDLPATVSGRAAAFRMTGSTARLLVALDWLPDVPSASSAEIFRGPIHLAPSVAMLAEAYAAWRAGTIPQAPPVMLRFASATDPALCAWPAAVMTATIGCVPARLFDGSWTREKRDALRDRVLTQAQSVLPGLTARVIATQLIVPPDMEEQLGVTDGDLWGGDIAPDQMLGLRPWLEQAGPRTPIAGVYLAGPSSAAGPLGTCAAGVIAANAVAADLKAERLK